MKRLMSYVLLSMSVGLTACSTAVTQSAAHAPVAPSTKAVEPTGLTVRDESGSALLQKVEYRAGMSTASVERLAKNAGCAGTGAGLVTEKGPVEIYRMQCANGSIFLARCELRQCRPLR